MKIASFSPECHLIKHVHKLHKPSFTWNAYTSYIEIDVEKKLDDKETSHALLRARREKKTGENEVNKKAKPIPRSSCISNIIYIYIYDGI